MRLRGGLADYNIDYRAGTTYLMVESNGTPYWRDDNLMLAFEAHSGVFQNKFSATASHLILRVRTDLLYELWMKLVPAHAAKWLAKKASVLANTSMFLRGACLLLRRGLQPINVTMGSKIVTLYVTEDESTLVENAWHTQPDLHGRLTAHELDKKSDGAITVFEEGFGPLEERGERWVTYVDSCLASFCGSSFYDIVSEYSGHPSDVVRDVLNGIQSVVVESIRMGVSLGLSDVSMQIPFIGRLDGSAFFARNAGRFKSRLEFSADPYLRRMVEDALNIVQPYPAEFGGHAFYKYERVQADGNKKSSEETDEAGSKKGEAGRTVFVSYDSEEDNDAESSSSEEIYSDGHDPWDDSDAELQGEVS